MTYEANLPIVSYGLLNGIKKQYAGSGYLWLEEKYRDGKLDGLSRRYNKNGRIVKEIYYEKGEAISR